MISHSFPSPIPLTFPLSLIFIAFYSLNISVAHMYIYLCLATWGVFNNVFKFKLLKIQCFIALAHISNAQVPHMPCVCCVHERNVDHLVISEAAVENSCSRY